jgi:glutathione S-transferase
VVFESPAIALYLTDQYPKNHLGPLVGEPERGDYLTWLSYYSGVLEPAIVSKFLNQEVPRGTAGCRSHRSSSSTCSALSHGRPMRVRRRGTMDEGVTG